MAAPPSFVTVPAELLAVALACHSHLKNSGYSPKSELTAEYYPESATIYCKQGIEERFYIIDSRVKDQRVDMWASYGKSCSSATLITFCIPSTASTSAATMAKLSSLGIGLMVVDSGTAVVTSISAPADLTMNVSLPPLTAQPNKFRIPMVKIHGSFSSGDWKKGFGDACTLVESAARKYLLKQVKKAGPVQYKVGSKTKTLTQAGVTKMTLGQLANTFCNMLAPKLIDGALCTGLKRINPDRVSIAHGLLTAQKEKRLRQNVGRHMWVIHNLLVQLAR